MDIFDRAGYRARQLHPGGSCIHCRQTIEFCIWSEETAKRINGHIVNPHSREWSWELNNFNIHPTQKNKKWEPFPQTVFLTIHHGPSPLDCILRRMTRKPKIELAGSLFWQRISTTRCIFRLHVRNVGNNLGFRKCFQLKKGEKP